MSGIKFLLCSIIVLLFAIIGVLGGGEGGYILMYIGIFLSPILMFIGIAMENKCTGIKCDCCLKNKNSYELCNNNFELLTKLLVNEVITDFIQEDCDIILDISNIGKITLEQVDNLKHDNYLKDCIIQYAKLYKDNAVYKLLLVLINPAENSKNEILTIQYVFHNILFEKEER